MKSKTGKRGRPKGSTNKKVFQCDALARGHAVSMIATYRIDNAEQLAEKILEKIRAMKKRMDKKYSQTPSSQTGGSSQRPAPPVLLKGDEKQE